jgi:hypothetical protein
MKKEIGGQGETNEAIGKKTKTKALQGERG